MPSTLPSRRPLWVESGLSQRTATEPEHTFVFAAFGIPPSTRPPGALRQVPQRRGPADALTARRSVGHRAALFSTAAQRKAQAHAVKRTHGLPKHDLVANETWPWDERRKQTTIARASTTGSCLIEFWAESPRLPDIAHGISRTVPVQQNPESR